MKPVLALVGRPNVGKSTLFNRLTKSRDAIVADFAGLTRDRHYGQGHLGAREYIVIDTGGFEPTAESGIYKEMAKQTRQAVAEADVVVFIVDGRAGLSAQDHDIANYLRRLGKPCLLVANKAEGMTEGAQLAEFYELGLGAVVPVSAAHGQGVRGMLEAALDALALSEGEETEEPEDDGSIRLAVAGRPNVGKSTLINTLAGRAQAKTGDEAGVTKLEQRIVVADDFYLWDTPGMLWPRIIVEQSGYKLAASGAVGRNAFDDELVALETLAYLQQHYADRIEARYGVAGAAQMHDDELLTAIGQRRGAMMGGGRVNLQKAAEIVLNDFRSGAIGRVTLETPEEFDAWLATGRQLEAERLARKAERDKERARGRRH